MVGLAPFFDFSLFCISDTVLSHANGVKPPPACTPPTPHLFTGMSISDMYFKTQLMIFFRLSSPNSLEIV